MDGSGGKIDVAHYGRILRRRAGYIIALPLLCAIGAGLYSAAQDPVYAAKSRVRINLDDIETETALVTSSDVRTRVATEAEALLGEVESVSAGRQGETELVDIRVQAGSAEAASTVANAYAEGYSSLRNEGAVRRIEDERAALGMVAVELGSRIVDAQTEIDLLELAAPGERNRARLAELQTELSQLEAEQRDVASRRADLGVQLAEVGNAVSVVDLASQPRSPVSPDPVAAVIAGLAAGLVLGFAGAALAELIDDRIRSSADLERWAPGRPVIASIPRLPKRHDASGPLALWDPRHGGTEAYRVLRTSLQFLAVEHSVRRLLVTSASPGEGKTTTVSNLAVTAARSGRDVVAVDTDLRRPNLHRAFRVNNEPGLTDVAITGDTATSVLHEIPGTGPGRLHVLTAGPTPPNPAELIGSTVVAQVFDELTAASDTVLIDSMCVLEASDTMALAPNADGVVLVVRVRRSRGRTLAAAIARLDRLGVPVIGVVLNGEKSSDPEYAPTTRLQSPDHRSVKSRAKLASRASTTL